MYRSGGTRDFFIGFGTGLFPVPALHEEEDDRSQEDGVELSNDKANLQRILPSRELRTWLVFNNLTEVPSDWTSAQLAYLVYPMHLLSFWCWDGTQGRLHAKPVATL